MTDQTTPAPEAGDDCAASCGEYGPDQVCGDHAAWNQPEQEADAG